MCICIRGIDAGTYEVTDFKRAYGANVLQAASTSTAVGANEVENTWKHVQKVSAVGVAEARPVPFSSLSSVLHKETANIIPPPTTHDND